MAEITSGKKISALDETQDTTDAYVVVAKNGKNYKVAVSNLKSQVDTTKIDQKLAQLEAKTVATDTKIGTITDVEVKKFMTFYTIKITE